MTAWWYWLLFLLLTIAVTAAATIEVCARLEERAKRRNREAWARMPGATR